MRIMTRRLCVVILFIASEIAPAAPVQKAGNGTGFQLLEKLVLLLDKAGRDSGTPEDWNAAVLGMAKELKSARAAKQVDDIFAVRCSRLLSALRQALLGDPEVLYWPMYRFSMIDFIEERTGRMPDWNRLQSAVHDHGGSSVGLAMIVEAVMSEVVSLHVHLEASGRRQEILQGYIKKIPK